MQTWRSAGRNNTLKQKQHPKHQAALWKHVFDCFCFFKMPFPSISIVSVGIQGMSSNRWGPHGSGFVFDPLQLRSGLQQSTARDCPFGRRVFITWSESWSSVCNGPSEVYSGRWRFFSRDSPRIILERSLASWQGVNLGPQVEDFSERKLHPTIQMLQLGIHTWFIWGVS